MQGPFGEDPLQEIEWWGHVTELLRAWLVSEIIQGTKWVVKRAILRAKRPAPWKQPTLSLEELGELHQALHRRLTEKRPGGTSYGTRYLTGMQANETLREHRYLGRRVDLPSGTLIGTSSFGKSAMAFVLADVPGTNPGRADGRETLRFRCYSRRRGMKSFLLRTAWKDEIRVRGRISGCGWGLGGDPIRLSNCEFEDVS